MGIGSFPGVKWPGFGVDPPPPSSAEVEGKVDLYICSPSELSWPVLGRTLPFTFYEDDDEAAKYSFQVSLRKYMEVLKESVSVMQI